ncbi:MAG: hypothetical protein GY768_18530 [Planctomycetaceae bacterium]|nr:hypothetical protein [Planctomycetaceae bacterium]
MDRSYSGAKFILTVRDEKAWIRSVLSHFGHQSTEMRRWVFGKGSPKSNEQIYL